MSAAKTKRRHPPRTHWICWNPWEMMEAAEDLSATEELAYLQYRSL